MPTDLPVSERAPPPHFAGRKHERAVLHQRLDDMLRHRSPGDGMALVTGVPGVGKTQLGRRFAEEATQHDAVDVRCIFVSVRLLNSDVGLFMAMGRALGCEDAFRRSAEIDTRSTGGGAAVGPFRANRTREHVRHTGQFPELLMGSRSTTAWDGKALVAIVDELQGVQPEGMAALQEMHEGVHGCPILLLGIGLQHTARVLSNPANGAVGISRPGTRIRLGSLSAAEALEAVQQGLAALQRPVQRHSAAALARASYGFPQHIHGYLQGACDAIEKHGTLDTEAALSDALQVGHQRRIDYYNGRLETLTNPATLWPVIAAMANLNKTTLTRDQATQAIAAARRENADAALDEAVRHGVLTEDEQRNLSFGIPSFHSYMLQQLEAGARCAPAGAGLTVAKP